MDIKSIQYLKEIVRYHYNLSETAKNINITQPALSQSMRRLEDELGTELFVRKKGMLTGLTQAGESCYHDGLILLEAWQKLQDNITDINHSISGRIRIGIPPLVESVLFGDLIAELMFRNRYQLEIVEEGALGLSKKLLLGEVDCAVLISPVQLSKDSFISKTLVKDDLMAFLSVDHRLASQEKIFWEDLRDEKVASFDNTYMIDYLLMHKFLSLGIPKKPVITSKSWDFLLQTVRFSDTITFMPTPVRDNFLPEGVKAVPMEDPLHWEVVLVYPRNKRFKDIENIFFEKISSHFSYNMAL